MADIFLREAEIANIPFLGALAGCSARRSERRVASYTSEEQRRNAPARAAKNGILAFSASLSYAEEDRAAARRIVGVLEAQGWSVWWDRRIPTGKTWRSAIEDGIRDMRCMVVLWSSHSIGSEWVNEEAEEGRAAAKLMPVLIERVRPPLGPARTSGDRPDRLGWFERRRSHSATDQRYHGDDASPRPGKRPAGAAFKAHRGASRRRIAAAGCEKESVPPGLGRGAGSGGRSGADACLA